ncbi:MAG: Stp1/IreP family PP2C-type Ser/Thr phosphatase [Bdellovibrionales bacterium]|nr:Stp1/IreP family PP2C-type Ser/Thr phosphatase [Bdellovibrionales bacterium]
MKALKIDSVLLSDIGMKRKQNQDSGVIRPELGLFMVADGMGGHQGGEIASKLCVEKVAEHVKEHNKDDLESETLLHQSLLVANQAIYDHSQQDQNLHGMGTTATVLQIRKKQATIMQIGDSRCYYWNAHGIWQLTRDHSLVQEKLRAGLITRDQLRTDEMKNVITRSVGYEPSIKVDAYHFTIEAGDGFLLCSDGLSGPVNEEKMFDILVKNVTVGVSLEDKAQQLVQAANDGGGDDNVTVVLVTITK